MPRNVGNNFHLPLVLTLTRVLAERVFYMKRLYLLLLFLAGVGGGMCAQAQSWPQPDALFLTVKSLDARLFDAYNHCDLTTLGAMVSDDLEFYHDQTGLSVGKAPFLAAIKQNICGKVERELLPQTLEVYPLKGYGAVEIGIHRFHHPGHPEDGGGDARFITLWQNKDGVWKVTRVISYEHNHGLLVK
jgi:ketosteroid isomerase-like protein